MFKSLGLFVVAVIFSFQAKAGLIVEPVLGYNYGVGIEYGTNPLYFPLDQQGLLYGAKVSYSLESFFFGLEHSISEYDATWDLVAPIPDVIYETEQTQTGLHLGFVSESWRFWFTYFFDAKQDWNNTNSLSRQGSGYGLGASYKALDYLSLNLEGHLFNYTEDFDGNSVESFEPIYVVFSVSFPFQVLGK